jgi:hypothetical protein
MRRSCSKQKNMGTASGSMRLILLPPQPQCKCRNYQNSSIQFRGQLRLYGSTAVPVPLWYYWHPKLWRPGCPPKVQRPRPQIQLPSKLQCVRQNKRVGLQFELGSPLSRREVFQVGLIYVGAAQTDTEIFENQSGSSSYQNFLKNIGWIVRC